jgi:hypothetical protein
MHEVQVDSEVFEFVKSKSEPLVDTFNSSLKRLLMTGGVAQSKPIAKAQPSELLVPMTAPVALRQTLAVIRLVDSGVDRIAATQEVAKREGVARETVQDKYCRQLGLSAEAFDELLAEIGRGRMSRLLASKFPKYSHQIRTAIGADSLK